MTRERGPIRRLYHLGLERIRPRESVEWEIEHHMAELVDRLVEQGLSEQEARDEAERRFGDASRYGPAMTRLEKRRVAMRKRTRVIDFVRQAWDGELRSARRYPGFTLAVVVTLGLGIGANATMFGIVDRLLLRPPDHITNPDRVRRVVGRRPSLLGPEIVTQASITYPDYADLKEHHGMDVAAQSIEGLVTVGRGEGATRARLGLVTAEYFPLLGVQPRLGRFYTADEAQPGSTLVAVVSEEYWRGAWGADPDVLGRVVELNGNLHTVIGVAPKGFTGVDLERVDFWVPLEATHVAEWGDGQCLDSRGCWWMEAVARLHPDVTEEAAEAEATQLHLNGRADQIESGRYSPTADLILTPLIAAAGPEPSAETRVAKWLAGVSLIVLLIACANVANLLLARGTRRRREVAVRIALGVDRSRLIADTVLESVMLAAMGGGVALVIARWGGDLVRSVLLPGVSFPDSAVNLRVVAVTLIASLVAGLVAGVGPALQGSRVDVAGDLGAAGRGSSGRRSSLRSFLTAAQAAMSVVLLVGAGLFVRSLGQLRGVDLGLDIDRLLMTRIEYTTPDLDDAAKTELYREAMQRVAELPSVQSVAATGVPFMWGFAQDLTIPGLDSIPTLPGGGPYYYPVTKGYFETVGLEVLRGRPIDERDGPTSDLVTVVSETMARTLWPDQDALGQCLMVGDEEAGGCTTVVGMVEDAARGGYQDKPYMAYYLPLTQVKAAPEAFYVRVRGEPAEAIGQVAPVVRAAAPEVRYATVQSMEDLLDPQARSWTLGATMFSVFGLLALALAAVGLYSVLAFDVAQRTREIGIRSALGAARARLLRAVVAQGTRMALLGIGVGLVAALIAAPYAQDLLFGVSAKDPTTFVGVAVALLAVGGLASLAPGLRATRIDPLRALRTD